MAKTRRPPSAPPFESIYRHGYARVAAATPRVEVASPALNVAATLELARRAARDQAVLAVFPELGLSAYSNEDLFQQDALLDASLEALRTLVAASRDLSPALAVGLPLPADDRLFNCAVLVHRGRILGAVPKSYLPNYREFYEKRQFAPAAQAVSPMLRLLGQDVPFGPRLLFAASDLAGFVLHLEICEDLWVPLPPSTLAALAGATVLANLSASDITVGKADYRRLLCASQSAKCVAACLYSAAGPGESTTDLAWDGHALIYENGERLAESTRFPLAPGLITADLDLDHLRQERMRLTSFGDNAQAHAAALREFRRVEFEIGVPAGRVPLRRRVERFPYVPADPSRRDERCAEVYDIQVEGLMKRLAATGLQKVVIGISGGLDSTQAALVAVRAFDRLKLPRRNILGYTLPGLGTSRHTFDSAHTLMKAIGISAGEIDISAASKLMLDRIGHPAAAGKRLYDVTYENVQAGERTSTLFRLANLHGGLVLGTGDLSELALGFTTYGVGDHMSHYNVNASVPKTLIRHLIRWLVQTRQFDAPTLAVLTRIVEIGYAINMNVQHIPVVVVDQSLDARSRAYLDDLVNSTYFDIAATAFGQEEAIRLVDAGTVSAAIIIPPDFSAHVERGEARVLVLVDGSEHFTALSAYNAANIIGQNHATRAILERAGRAGQADTDAPLEIFVRILYNPDFKDLWFIIPSIIALLLQTQTIVLTANAVVRERGSRHDRADPGHAHPPDGIDAWKDHAQHHPGDDQHAHHPGAGCVLV